MPKFTWNKFERSFFIWDYSVVGQYTIDGSRRVAFAMAQFIGRFGINQTIRNLFIEMEWKRFSVMSNTSAQMLMIQWTQKINHQTGHLEMCGCMFTRLNLCSCGYDRAGAALGELMDRYKVLPDLEEPETNIEVMEGNNHESTTH